MLVSPRPRLEFELKTFGNGNHVGSIRSVLHFAVRVTGALMRPSLMTGMSRPMSWVNEAAVLSQTTCATSSRRAHSQQNKRMGIFDTFPKP